MSSVSLWNSAASLFCASLAEALERAGAEDPSVRVSWRDLDPLHPDDYTAICAGECIDMPWLARFAVEKGPTRYNAVIRVGPASDAMRAVAEGSPSIFLWERGILASSLREVVYVNGKFWFRLGNDPPSVQYLSPRFMSGIVSEILEGM